MGPFDLIAGLALAPIALIDTAFLLETGLGLRPDWSPPPPARDKQVVVLVPAHNEERTLAASGAGLVRLQNASTRVVLIADNCSDATAEVARGMGLEVVERQDAVRRGKGYALAFGRDHIAASPPDVVVVVDADCEIDPAGLACLTDSVIATGRAAQAAYLFRPAPTAPPVVQISNFAFFVKNRIRQRGIQRLGGAAILTGSGMAFPWAPYAALDLATGNVVEDLAIGIGLIELGQPAGYFDGATVRSDCSSDDGSSTQRARWEGGFLAMARRHGLGLLGSGIARGNWSRFWMGMHLCVPPLSMLLAANVAITLLLAVAALLGVSVVPLIVAVVLLGLLGAVVVLAWMGEGRMHLHPDAAVQLPRYLAWKLAMYARLLTGRQRVAWTRTERIDP